MWEGLLLTDTRWIVYLHCQFDKQRSEEGTHESDVCHACNSFAIVAPRYDEQGVSRSWAVFVAPDRPAQADSSVPTSSRTNVIDVGHCLLWTTRCACTFCASMSHGIEYRKKPLSMDFCPSRNVNLPIRHLRLAHVAIRSGCAEVIYCIVSLDVEVTTAHHELSQYKSIRLRAIIPIFESRQDPFRFV